MKIQWIGKNVDLELLSNCIEIFFQNKTFNTSKELSNGQIKFSTIKNYDKNPLIIFITIGGDSKGFFVEIECKNISDSLQKLSHFFTTMGLGPLLFKKLKLYEHYKEVEDEFCRYLEKVVSDLSHKA
ncbi:MAG: hypothetical protein QXU21_07025 [Candidatus Bathyarchaeia archaeon]